MYLQRFLSLVRVFFPCGKSVLVLALLLVFNCDFAQASTLSLLLSPVRIIFSDRQRVVTAHVINSGNEEITYTISLVTMRKGPEGEFFQPRVETDEELLAKSLVRFSPRRATIGPRQRQVVKLMIRKPKDLLPGEYQTRLLLSPQTKAKETVTDKNSASTEKGIGINIEYIVNTSVPIIIQHGGISAEVTPVAVDFKELSRATSGLAAEILLTRNGDASSFGNLYVHYLSKNGKEKRIGHIQGAAIYIPMTKKTFIVPLENVTPQDLTSGSIRIDYHSSVGRPDKRKKTDKISSKTFNFH